MQEEILLNISELSDKVPNLSYVKEIKSGKEATVHLLTDGLKLYALKIYKKNIKFSSRLDYLNIASVGDARTRRAIKNRSKKGRSMLENIWTDREYTLMKNLNYETENIPTVYASTNTGILMEYLGTEISPAPRLVDISLEQNIAHEVFTQICPNIELFLDFGIVNGDLSAYNILWWSERPYIIDFPQALEIANNKNAFEKLNGDLSSLRKYFSKYLDDGTIQKRFNTIQEKYFYKSIYG